MNEWMNEQKINEIKNEKKIQKRKTTHTQNRNILALILRVYIK